jgi:hypothetical protein
MQDCETAGVEADRFVARVGQALGTQRHRRSVLKVSHDWPAAGCQLDPNLMRAPGEGFDFE